MHDVFSRVQILQVQPPVLVPSVGVAFQALVLHRSFRALALLEGEEGVLEREARSMFVLHRSFRALALLLVGEEGALGREAQLFVLVPSFGTAFRAPP